MLNVYMAVEHFLQQHYVDVSVGANTQQHDK